MFAESEIFAMRIMQSKITANAVYLPQILLFFSVLFSYVLVESKTDDSMLIVSYPA